LWIRCKLIKNNNYFIPPRIEYILTNTVSCKFGYGVEKKIKNQSPLLSKSVQTSANYSKANKNKKFNEEYYEVKSNGLSNQIFEIDDKLKLPILEIDYLKVDGKKWAKVEDFDSSTPLDNHYVLLDKKNGFFKFGDGENAKIPKKGSTVQIKYRYGNPKTMFVKETKTFKPDIEKINENAKKFYISKIKDLIGVNLFPSTGGRQAESIQETINRAREELLVPFKAVSKTDCEFIVKNTPGLRIGKVKVMPKLSDNPKEKNTLIVSAMPYSFSMINNSSRYYYFKNAVKKHLDKHKLLTTTINVLLPEYIKINITIKIKLFKSHIDQYFVKEKITKLLNTYFSPISFNNASSTSTKEWDFGENVYKSKIIAILESLPEIEYVSSLDFQVSGQNQGYDVDEGGNIIIEDLFLVYLKDVFISFI